MAMSEKTEAVSIPKLQQLPQSTEVTTHKSTS